MTFNRHINGDHLGACSAVHKKIIQNANERERTRPVDTIPDPHKLSSLVHALDSNLSLAEALQERMRNAMDFVCGPQPQESGAKAEHFTSALDVLNEKQRQLWLQLDRLDTQVRRLERVVG